MDSVLGAAPGQKRRHRRPAAVPPTRSVVHTNAGRPTIAALVGSLRRRSHNRRLLDQVRLRLADVAIVAEADLAALPYFDEDIDLAGSNIDVRRYRHLIATADAVLVLTPEYNGSLPGVLKNAIDWASRPFLSAPLSGKPTLLIAATRISAGGNGVRAHLRDVLQRADADVVAELGIPRVDRCWDHGGRSLDPVTQRSLDEALGVLLASIGEPPGYAAGEVPA